MKQLNLIRKESNKIIFTGFDKVHDLITVKIFSNRLVIVPNKQEGTLNGRVFQLKNKESQDIELLRIINDCCKKDTTAFIENNGVYYQAEDVQV